MKGSGTRGRARERSVACWLAAITALASCGGEAPAGRTGPPNLVLVIGDDHGFTDFGFMGSPVVQTPRLDALAAEGVVFPTGYSSASVCQPALRTLLTGLEPIQFEARERAFARSRAGRGPGQPPLIASLETLPRLLRERGYASFEAGKIWEGHYRDVGFDAGMVEHAGFDGADQARRLVRETVEPVFDFLEREADGPFFLWFAPLLPHLPHDPPPRFRRLYPDTPKPTGYYYASISWFDAAVGDLVDRIDALGLTRDTLIVYVVDNGWDPAPMERAGRDLIGGPRGKLSLHELGLRTPVVLRWPGRLAPARRPELVAFADVYATLLDFADLPQPQGRIGYSLRPLFERGEAWPRRTLIGWMPLIRQHYGNPGPASGGFFWRDARWHFLLPHEGEPALYDVSEDPAERPDRLAAHPEVVERARADIDAWVRRVGG